MRAPAPEAKTMTLDVAFSIARSGLRLLDRQMAATSGNIANAGVEGHTRKTVDGRTLTAEGEGIGVRTRPAARDVDLALQASAIRTGGDAANAGLRSRLLSGVEAAHGTPGSEDSIAGALAALRSRFTLLREAPADAARQADAVQAAGDAVTRIRDVAGAIAAARQEAHDQMRAEAGAANAALGEIGRLTIDIRREIAVGRSAADLEDRRDQAISRLAESLDIGVIRKADGDVVVVARGGLTLPLRDDAFSVDVANVAPETFHGPGGTLPGLMLGGQDVTRRVLGGRLAAAAELRDATLPRMQAEIDVQAAQLADRFLRQGLRLFSDGAGNVPDPALPYAGGAMIGFAAEIRVNPAVQATPRLMRDGTDPWPGFAPNPPGGPAGFATLLDRVLDRSFGTESAPGVPHPAFATAGLGPDGTLTSTLSGQLTLQDYAAALVESQSGARAAADAAGERAQLLGGLLNDRIQARSGVDLDREVSSMVTLQTAYGVNARVISTLQAMWDALFGAVR
jgi:flagellar hook-associated protein 1 FlgK